MILSSVVSSDRSSYEITASATYTCFFGNSESRGEADHTMQGSEDTTLQGFAATKGIDFAPAPGDVVEFEPVDEFWQMRVDDEMVRDWFES